MEGSILVLGYGPCGQATVEALHRAGRRVVVSQRRRPAALPPGVAFEACDLTDAAAVRQAAAGAAQVVLAIGLPYDRRVWRESWPGIMTNVLDVCAAAGARLIFIDGLYMLGPQRAPLREDMPLTDYGAKPAIRSAITRLWMAAAAQGRVRVADLRAPDFYGPGVTNSHLGSMSLQALALGKVATLIAPPDIPHDFAYVPDIARATLTLIDAPDDDFNQVWNMPCAPTRTPRQILDLGAAALGHKAKIRAIPLATLPLLGLVSPLMREASEMRFLLDRPYHVDAGKWTRRFWSDVTPFEVGVPTTIRSFAA